MSDRASKPDYGCPVAPVPPSQVTNLIVAFGQIVAKDATLQALLAKLGGLPPAPQGKQRFRDLGAVVQVKAGAGMLCALRIINTGQPTAFIQLFDAPSPSAVNLGTTLPDWELQVFGDGSEPQDFVIPFFSGIQIASTTTEKGATPSAAGVMAFLTYS